jgi:8-oxo-dGTP pyrophosphatase MutT (NUDIX family)
MVRIDYFNDENAPKANSIIPAASAIIADAQGNILLHQRTDNDLWALPGGKMEVGESIGGTIVREVKEETGFEVRPKYVIGIYTNPNHVIAFSDGEVRQEFSLCFYCEIVGGEIKVSNESYEVAFFSLQEIEHLNMHPSIRLRIQHYLEHRKQPFFS